MSLRIRVLLLVVCVSWPSVHAVAQQSPASEDRKWEIEVHAGGMRIGKPTDATTAMPAAGEPFTTTNGRPSRYVSSWYFGDGAALRNQNAAAFTPIPLNARIVPLDSVLTGVAARSSNGASYGLRAGRRLTSRLTAEFNADYGPFRLEWLDRALTEIEASRASFATVWNEVYGAGPFLNPDVTSLSQIDKGGGGQFVTTGTLKVTLRRSGPLVPYITGGMGGAFSRGRAPNATLKGSYSAGFVFQGQGGILVRFDESDSVSVRLVQPERALVGVVGGGFTHDLSPRNGLRVDLRLHLRPHAVDTEVSASPAVTTGTPAWRLASAVTPSVQFSNMGSTEIRSSLSGPAISAFRTREGSGVQIDTALTVGYFWRF
jgi:hypothetical protein